MLKACRRFIPHYLTQSNVSLSDPFAVKRNVARSLNSQQMYEYILHCLKTTYKYFALPLNTPAGDKKNKDKKKAAQQHEAVPQAGAEGPNEEVAAALGRLDVRPQPAGRLGAAENGPEDSDCIIEEEEEVEEHSDSDEEREKEKADPGKSSLSEDEDVDAQNNRQHFDSVTTEDEDIFLLDEISGEELLSDEEGPDLDTPGSMDDDDDDEGGELASAGFSSPHLEESVNEKSPENASQQPKRRSYEFTRQAFTRGKVCVASC